MEPYVEDLAHGNKIVFVEEEVDISPWPRNQACAWRKESRVDVWKQPMLISF